MTIHFLFNDLKLLKFDFLCKFFCFLTVYNDLTDNDNNRKLFRFIHHSQDIRSNNFNLPVIWHGLTFLYIVTFRMFTFS